ncbi:hypothetical protein AtEden1_Chr5g0112201 [Arabidopsis thaliana]
MWLRIQHVGSRDSLLFLLVVDVGWCNGFFSWFSRRIGLCNYGGSRCGEGGWCRIAMMVRELTTACRDVGGLTIPRDLWWEQLIKGKGTESGVGCFISVY